VVATEGTDDQGTPHFSPSFLLLFALPFPYSASGPIRPAYRRRRPPLFSITSIFTSNVRIEQSTPHFPFSPSPKLSSFGTRSRPSFLPFLPFFTEAESQSGLFPLSFSLTSVFSFFLWRGSDERSAPLFFSAIETSLLPF